MALKINIQTNEGVISQYLRVKDVLNKMLSNVARPISSPVTTIVVELWLDEDFRIQAKENVGLQPLTVKSYQTEAVFTDIASAYDYLKTLPELSEAIDC